MSVNRCTSLTRGRLKGRHGQKGLGMIGSLLVILVGGLLLTCAIKMIPIYFQNWNIQSILNDLEPEFADVGTVTKKAIENKLAKRLNIDMISAIKVNDIEIKKIKSVFKMTRLSFQLYSLCAMFAGPALNKPCPGENGQM